MLYFLVMSGPPPVEGSPVQGWQQPAYVPQGPAPPFGVPRPGVPASTWVASIVIAAVVALVTWGGYLVGGATGASLGIETDVVQGVTVRLPQGWAVYEPLQDPLGFLASSAAGNVIVGVVEGRESANAVASAYFNDTLVSQADQVVAGDLFAHEVPAGEAVSFRYLGVFPGFNTQLDGEVFAIRTPSGVAVIVDGWAAEGGYPYIAEQILTMAQTVEVA